MKNKRFLLLIIVIVFFIFSIIFSLLNFGSTEIVSGISIGNINLSRFTKENSIQLLNELISQRDKKELSLVYTTDKEKYEKKLDLTTLEIKYDIENSVNKAYSIGKTGNIFQCNLEIAKTFIFKKNINLDY